MLNFVPIPPPNFHTTESIYNSFKLPQLSFTPKLGPRSEKMGPELPTMGKITIFPYLKWLECSFLFPSPDFPPHRVHFNHPQLLVAQKLGPRSTSDKMGPKTPKRGKITIFRKISTSLSPFIIVSNIHNYTAQKKFANILKTWI